MILRELQVLHRSEAIAELPPAVAAAAADGRAFIIHTCQRLVAVTVGEAERDLLRAQLGSEQGDAGQLTVHSGNEAYAFLLRLACGLESRLIGETEVFGQLKQFWNTFAERRSLLSQQLARVMQSLFRDAKEVRSGFLSGLGSASYGSLVRRLLDRPGARGPILLIGAGQLAASVAPWLKGTELWIWNRNADKAQALAAELLRRDATRQVRVLESTDEAELAAWHAARHVVVCIPADARRDAVRAAAWMAPRQSAPERGQLVHLGVNDGADLSDWISVGDMLHLGAVYQLLQAHNELRQAQVARATRACELAAARIATGRRQSRPQGWKNLAADTLCS